MANLSYHYQHHLKIKAHTHITYHQEHQLTDSGWALDGSSAACRWTSPSQGCRSRTACHDTWQSSPGSTERLKGRILGLTRDLMNQNLHSNKIPGRSTCTLKLEKKPWKILLSPFLGWGGRDDWSSTAFELHWSSQLFQNHQGSFKISKVQAVPQTIWLRISGVGHRHIFFKYSQVFQSVVQNGNHRDKGSPSKKWTELYSSWGEKTLLFPKCLYLPTIALTLQHTGTLLQSAIINPKTIKKETLPWFLFQISPQPPACSFWSLTSKVQAHFRSRHLSTLQPGDGRQVLNERVSSCLRTAESHKHTQAESAPSR